MKKSILIPGLILAGAALLVRAVPVSGADAAQDAAAAAAEKEKAMKNPYPNDLGPDKIDVSKYGAEAKEGYGLLLKKCTVCHTASRPLNSQFIQLKEEEAAAVKKANPEVFKDKLVWQVEDKIWERYVKRMMAKPGCNIPQPEGKKIFRFLVEDSKARKTGAATADWSKHRRKLLEDFKAKYPERYKELFEAK